MTLCMLQNGSGIMLESGHHPSSCAHHSEMDTPFNSSMADSGFPRLHEAEEYRTAIGSCDGALSVDVEAVVEAIRKVGMAMKTAMIRFGGRVVLRAHDDVIAGDSCF